VCFRLSLQVLLDIYLALVKYLTNYVQDAKVKTLGGADVNFPPFLSCSKLTNSTELSPP
jgi:hypothetical protein